MKKCVSLFLVLLTVCLLAGCSQQSSTGTSGSGASLPESSASSEESSPAAATPEPASPVEESSEPVVSAPEANEQPQTGSRVLVVYFSRVGEQYEVGVIDKGNTAVVAEAIADATGADTYEILPADDHYPMTYAELTDVAKQEQGENARPAMAGELPDLSGYDTVFIGAPVWWGDWPMICYTFFESADLTGKTVVPFSTHAGSGLSGFDTKLRSAVPGCTVGEGLAIRGANCQSDPDGVRSEVESWLAGLGYQRTRNVG